MIAKLFQKLNSVIKDKELFYQRLNVSSLSIYNFITTFISISNERINWKYGLKDAEYASKLGLGITLPSITPKFTTLFCFLNIFLSLCVLVSVIVPRRKNQHFLLAGIMWNCCTLHLHFVNIMEMFYDLIVISSEISLAIYLMCSGIFMMVLHFKFILEALAYYDYLALEEFIRDEGITIWDIEKIFNADSNNKDQ